VGRAALAEVLVLTMQYQRLGDGLNAMSSAMRPGLADRLMDTSAEVALDIAGRVGELLGISTEEATDMLEESWL
jgi:hypothetical protein